MTSKFNKTNFVLKAYSTDVTKIIEDNSVRDLQELEDRRIMDAIDQNMQLHPPFWKWHEHEGVVHMTGGKHEAFNPGERWRETLCGLALNPHFPNYPKNDHPGSVTCLGCLATLERTL